MPETVRVGIVGMGTIGTGVVRIFQEHAEDLRDRLGFDLRLSRIADIDLETDRGVSLSEYELSTDWRDLANDPEIDLIVELIGGTKIAKDVVAGALQAGKSIVTANKALLAHHGEELYALAAENSVDLAFEAAVGGTIPVLRALREGLNADRIETLHGIVNGTCNYILSEMEEGGEPYAACLKRAQDLGFAEADPTFDVDGTDSAHKLAILIGLAFGLRTHPDDIATEGIECIGPVDIEYARRFGLRIKLLAVAKRGPRGVEAHVHPTMISASSVLAGVSGSMNAVEVRGVMSGPTMYYGAGAGSLPTASAVVADLMELARARVSGATGRVPPLGRPRLRSERLLPAEDQTGEFYLRFNVVDSPGVLAGITGALGDLGISIASVLQEERHESAAVPVVITTHTSRQADLDAALSEIASMREVTEAAHVLRIEREI
ncbi:MAG: homoserine dehydrogenase [bacterium]|nr:homoserine dehydrogenase [bacterium]